MRTIRAASGASGANVGSAARGRNGTRLLKAALVGSFVACSSGGGGPSPSPPSLIETGGASPRSVITPTFGPTVTAPVPPRAISGGTLLATRDGTRAIAADSERDSVYVVNLKTHALDFAVALSAGDEPGRLTEDGAGRIHVALRSGGALATLDPSKTSSCTPTPRERARPDTLSSRRGAPAAPRGSQHIWSSRNRTTTRWACHRRSVR